MSVSTNPLAGRIAVVGVGYTEYSRNSGQTPLALATRACLGAIRDAGLTPRDVDGIICFATNDSIGVVPVANALGVPELNWFVDVQGGGNAAVSIIADAAHAIAAGTCRTVVLYRALNGRSGARLGQAGVFRGVGGEYQYTLPYGYVTPPQWFAMWCRRHMHEYGTTNEQLGAIAITLRDHAILNERAVMRRPMTLEDYLNSRWINEPFRLFDCCQESDGACALVLTSAERARDAAKPPVYIEALVYGTKLHANWHQWPDFSEVGAVAVADKLWAKAGLGPRDMDFAELYDCFTYSLLAQLEGFGFCAKGEGGPFAQSGALRLGGELPVNTHGGLLSEAYIHGLNHSVEAVEQLRGEAGPRQVADARVGLVTGGTGIFGSGIIYRR
jgi:acetyl-CoA acetyltransferase